jgi:hypothetical protein
MYPAGSLPLLRPPEQRQPPRQILQGKRCGPPRAASLSSSKISRQTANACRVFRAFAIEAGTKKGREMFAATAETDRGSATEGRIETANHDSVKAAVARVPKIAWRVRVGCEWGASCGLRWTRPSSQSAARPCTSDGRWTKPLGATAMA